MLQVNPCILLTPEDHDPMPSTSPDGKQVASGMSCHAKVLLSFSLDMIQVPVTAVQSYGRSKAEQKCISF